MSTGPRRALAAAAALSAAAALWSSTTLEPAPGARPATQAVAAAAPLASPRETGAGDDGITAAARETMLRQQPLLAAAAAIRPAAERAAAAGFAGIALEGPNLALYWKGGVPAAVRAAVDGARKSAPVVVKPAEHSRDELRAAADRVFAAGRSRGVTAVKYAADGSGLQVVTDAAKPVPALPATGVRVETVRQPVPRPVGKPAAKPAATARKAAVKAALASPFWTEPSRDDDVAPWWGGAHIIDAQGRYNNFGYWLEEGYHCTSGFAVRFEDEVRMLAPAHCSSADHVTTDGGGTQMNSIVAIAPDRFQNHPHDLLLLDAPNAEGYVYDGPQGSHRGKPVVGWGHMEVGETLCISGGQTGVLCDFKVSAWSVTRAIWTTDSDGDGTGNIKDLIEVTTPTQIRNLYARSDSPEMRNAISQGDDGSPMFTLSGAGVLAKGILITSEALAGNFTGRAYVQSFATAVTDFPGLEPVTAP